MDRGAWGGGQAVGLNESTTEQVTLSLFTKGLSFPHPVALLPAPQTDEVIFATMKTKNTTAA